MDIAPAAVTPELAASAFASPLLADAIKLAEWIGDGKEMTSDGELPAELMAEVCELLDVESPEEVDGSEVATLDVIWEAALEAGFIAVSDDRVSAVGLPTDPEQMLRCWLTVTLAPYGIPDEPSAEWVTVLAVLADATEPVSMLTLIEEVLSDFPSDADEEDDEEDREHINHLIGHVTLTVMGLRDLGAVSVSEIGDPDQYMVRLTPLGQMLADTVVTALTLVPDAMAGLVVRRFGQLTPRIAGKIAGPWLDGRTTVDAARELLDYAAYARADMRTVATGFVNFLGDEAEPAWRERVKDRGVGVYARAWLADHGENVPMDGRDAYWMQVEGFSAHTAGMPEALVVTLLADLRAREPDALHELRRAVNRSRHPDAPKLIDAMSQLTGQPTVTVPPVPPSEATGTSYRIRISLRYVDDPAVSRTIAVDAGTTLADLHTIIQAAMGWADEHPHGFGFDSDEVSDAAPLGRLLRKPGDSILYTYDFGDNWEHDVILEGIDQNSSGAPLPALLDGHGACPPEDCGGAPGYLELKEIMADPAREEHDKLAEWLGADSFDPEEFSLATRAAAVTGVALSLRAEHRPAAVVRVQQPRRKKRRR
jgi:Plasmid pRiA4b ORF-3-like protein